MRHQPVGIQAPSNNAAGQSRTRGAAVAFVPQLIGEGRDAEQDHLATTTTATAARVAIIIAVRADCACHLPFVFNNLLLPVERFRNIPASHITTTASSSTTTFTTTFTTLSCAYLTSLLNCHASSDRAVTTAPG